MTDEEFLYIEGIIIEDSDNPETYKIFKMPIASKRKAKQLLTDKNSGQRQADHFEEILVMIDIGNGGKRKWPDIKLSRY